MKDEENTKFQQIVRTATDLFMRYGYSRVTIEEICQTSNVSKMTFYKHFSNKIDLILYIIGNIADEAIAEYQQIMQSDILYSEKVKKIIRMKIKQGESYSRELYSDLMQNPVPEVQVFIQKLQQENIERVTNDLKNAQEKGEIRSDLKPELIIYILNKMTDWTKDDELLDMFDDLSELTSEVMNFFFYGILPRH
jgi:AcrR family transcriptional regulator